MYLGMYPQPLLIVGDICTYLGRRVQVCTIQTGKLGGQSRAQQGCPASYRYTLLGYLTCLGSRGFFSLKSGYLLNELTLDDPRLTMLVPFRRGSLAGDFVLYTCGGTSGGTLASRANPQSARTAGSCRYTSISLGTGSLCVLAQVPVQEMYLRDRPAGPRARVARCTLWLYLGIL